MQKASYTGRRCASAPNCRGPQRGKPMAIRLPDLSKHRCKVLIVCGDLDTKDENLLQWVGSKKVYAAKYGPRNNPNSIRILLGHGKEGRSVHTEVVTKDFLWMAPAVEAKSKLSEVKDVLARIEG